MPSQPQKPEEGRGAGRGRQGESGPIDEESEGRTGDPSDAATARGAGRSPKEPADAGATDPRPSQER